MQKHLLNSEAVFPGGLAAGKRVLRVNSGVYAGRLAILMASSASEIKLSHSDFPYTAWSIPATVISDSADFPFDAVIDDSGNIYVAYTLTGSNDLVHRKLTFSEGAWGAGEPVTIYSGDDNYYPSIIIEPPSRLWVSWSRFSSGQYYINVKLSDDWGATWPGGPTSYGNTLSSPVSSAFSKILACGQYVYDFYNAGPSALMYRRKHCDVSAWDTEHEIAAGIALDSDFDAAVSDDGKIGVVFDDGRIRFCEYNNSIWSAIIDVDSDGGLFPQIRYFENVPYVIYLSDSGSNQKQALYCVRESEYFSLPAPFDPRKDYFSKVFCYRAVSGNYKDLTAAASQATPGDIFHSDSGVMFKESGDSLYLGLDDKFQYLRIILSTPGSGGTVSWQYYSGQEWAGFTPSGGEFNFDAADRGLLLWDDYSAMPAQWQKKNVNGADKFWIRAVVTVPFSTGPVGTLITSITECTALAVRE